MKIFEICGLKERYMSIFGRIIIQKSEALSRVTYQDLYLEKQAPVYKKQM